MNRPNNIHDKDKKLAGELRYRLEQNLPSGEVIDPLLQSLIEFKQSELAVDSDDLSSRKEKSWNVIKQNMNHSSAQKETAFYRLGSIRYLGKIAAAITISVLLSIYYFQTQSPLKPIAAADDTIKSITLTDGSNVMLRPHSTLYEKQIGEWSHTYYLEGEAYFDVVKNENRTFNVYTESGIVEVLGTVFDLRTWDNSTVVYLKTGSLRLSSIDKNDSGVLLSPGEFSSLKNDQSISAPRTADEKLFTSWRNNEIIFTNRSAKSIFSELEHHYSITIVAPEYINSEILGGSLSLENTAQSLNNLGTVLGGQFVLSGTNTYKFVSSE